SRFPAIADPPITGQNYPSWWTTFRGLFQHREIHDYAVLWRSSAENESLKSRSKHYEIKTET
ncbi:MAG: hypothetical protein AAFY09_15145, partial [Pseudomonadota bacterium]